MELKQFQGLALRTESKITGINLNAGNLIALLKVVIEVTEILDGVKKAVFYNKTAKLEGDFTARLHALSTLIEALKWQNSGRGPLGAVMADTSIENVDPRVFHGIIGIITESGELASALLKSLEDPSIQIDPVNIQEEMSDIAWYEAILHDKLGLDWGQGLENVINKLRIRYPEKYSDEAADNRDLTAERAALEVGVDSTNLDDAFKLWNAPAGFNRGPMTYVPGMGYVKNSDIEQGEVVEDTRRAYYVNIPDGTTPEELEVIMKELKDRFRHTQTYKAD